VGDNENKENISPLGEWTGGRLLGSQLFYLIEGGDE
jgi:hypothetical protein